MTAHAAPEPLQHVLVPLDGSDLARAALIPARRLLLGASDPTLTLLEVVETAEPAHLERLKNQALLRLRGEIELERERTQRLHKRMHADMRAPRISHLVEHGRAGEQILGLAGRLGVDTVAMTTHGRSGMGRLVRGSVAEEVLRATPVPLLVCTQCATRLAGPGDPFLRLLVPLDGSILAYQALPLAATISARTGAEVVLLRVGDEQTGGEGCLEHAAERLAGDGVRQVVRDLTGGEPAAAILEAIERHRVDLAVMTTHGRSGLDRLRLGSVAEQVLRRSPCPVLIRRGE